MIIEALKAVLFGIVEGITEWLPISSTGHMMLLNQFLALDVSPEFYATFLIVIQLGAIMAVICLYFTKLNPFSRKKTTQQKRDTWSIWFKVAVGTIPAGIVGLFLDDLLEEKIMNNPDIAYIVVSAALIVYGVIFIFIERRNRRLLRECQDAGERAYRGKHARRAVVQGDTELDASSAIAKVNSFQELGYGRAFLIGVFQSLAVIPGTSRSGSIIIGSMILGTSRTVATEFAFFLAIPLMFGWSCVKFMKHGFAYTGTEWMILGIGLVVAFIVSVLAIRFLVGYIKKNDFTAFGWYRIVLAVVMLAYFGLPVLL